MLFQREHMFDVSLQLLFLLTCGVTLGQEAGAVRVVVPESRDALLPVSIGRDAERDYFEWRKVGPRGETQNEVFKYDASLHYNNNGLPGQSEQFKGRVSNVLYELKNGNVSILIRNTTAADSGNYTCYFSRLQRPQTFYFELDVAATPKPRVMILNTTADRALLQCEVPGASLNTKAEWQSGDGNRLQAEEERVPEKDHVFISLSVNVTRTDHYLCVVSQEDIKHWVSAQISVHVSEKESEDSSGTMLIVGITSFVLGAVNLAAVLALLVFAKRIKILHNKDSALKGEEEINLSSNGTNGPVRDPSEEPLRPVQS
ncbi:CD276 antigen homolog [Gymnodraco acuticeps]|uniref:CD276 antigen homolog n=1 Tax=Gymnodraco acuticeps TaxID=8218 RepID=A0A6P8UKK0_GYMAC|nr:CD276 antigen homolog [Gymnodraco acuticeps]